jgi:steroid delta-isomerase-like uncharacterized protein
MTVSLGPRRRRKGATEYPFRREASSTDRRFVMADRDIVKRLTDEGFLEGNIAVVDELFADDFVDHDAPPGVPPTKDGVRLLIQAINDAFSNMAAEFDEYSETTDGRVVENWAMTGTHTGEIFGVPPSGENARVRGVEIFRCENDRIVEHWGAVDMSDVLQKAMGLRFDQAGEVGV